VGWAGPVEEVDVVDTVVVECEVVVLEGAFDVVEDVFTELDVVEGPGRHWL
jgi:hypothetical protein